MPRRRHISWRGETRTLTEWARVRGIDVKTLAKRLERGMPVADALNTPPLSRSACGRRGAAVSGWR